MQHSRLLLLCTCINFNIFSIRSAKRATSYPISSEVTFLERSLSTRHHLPKPVLSMLGTHSPGWSVFNVQLISSNKPISIHIFSPLVKDPLVLMMTNFPCIFFYFYAYSAWKNWMFGISNIYRIFFTVVSITNSLINPFAIVLNPVCEFVFTFNFCMVCNCR